LTGRRLPAGQRRNPLCVSVSLWFGLVAAHPRCVLCGGRTLSASDHKKKGTGMPRGSGFTLVELMVVTAIMAVLAAVAVPAYINYKDRAIQTEAVEALHRAKMDQESYWAEHNRYAATIRMLASFGNTRSSNVYTTGNSYRLQVDQTYTSTNRFCITAARTIRGLSSNTLSLKVSSTNPDGVLKVGDNGLSFSIFKWIFD
jgi:type IV pilus assembly protein PilE